MLGDIINGKYAKLLLALNKEGTNLSQLSKEVDLNLSALSVQISRFSIQGLVVKTKKGRESIADLTEYGKAQSDLIRQILENIKNNKSTEKEVKNDKERPETE